MGKRNSQQESNFEHVVKYAHTTFDVYNNEHIKQFFPRPCMPLYRHSSTQHRAKPQPSTASEQVLSESLPRRCAGGRLTLYVISARADLFKY